MKWVFLSLSTCPNTIQLTSAFLQCTNPFSFICLVYCILLYSLLSNMSLSSSFLPRALSTIQPSSSIGHSSVLGLASTALGEAIGGGDENCAGILWGGAVSSRV